MAGFYSEYLTSGFKPSDAPIALPLTIITGLCERRGWTTPAYRSVCTGEGYICYVVVKERTYVTMEPYTSESLAQENASRLAYMACYNHSQVDGMFAKDGVLQGVPCVRSKDGDRRIVTPSHLPVLRPSLRGGSCARPVGPIPPPVASLDRGDPRTAWPLCKRSVFPRNHWLPGFCAIPSP